jgi:diguanylate cyclase (GGDEF)-like protein
LFNDRLQQEIKKAQRDQNFTALLFIDLDHFKEVNDALGHEVGDRLLIEAAGRIKSCVRDYDTIARLGGDEFTVILSNLKESSDIERIAQNIIDLISEPFIFDSKESFVSASIGIALYPNDATDANDLIKNADQAMYTAKSDGRGCFRFFTKEMQAASQLRSRLARDLRYALGAQEFEVYYQTIVELNSGHIHKAEALLRWKHPELGFISPAVFIPIAENTGTINYIGDWVFMQAAKQVKHLQSVLNRDFQISINKSPVQFKVDTPCHELWIKWLSEMDLPGSSIAIEITEGLLMDAETKVKDKLLSFRDAGIQVSIDDFGTGYSALSYLKKFDIDFLKIDQSFTKNLAADSQDLALCEAIVVMAHKLGIKVIAEGVETEQQRDLLIKMGCDYGQGYLFSRPIPAVEFEKILAIG